MKRFVWIAVIVLVLAYVVGQKGDKEPTYGMTAQESHRVHMDRERLRIHRDAQDDLRDAFRRIGR